MSNALEAMVSLGLQRLPLRESEYLKVAHALVAQVAFPLTDDCRYCYATVVLEIPLEKLRTT